MSKHLWTRSPAIALVAAVLVASACSSDTAADVEMPEGVNIGTLPLVTDGARCEDPTGDISAVASEVNGTLTEPAGIDLVSVTAEVSDTELVVTYTTAGPIAAVGTPEFLLSQGVSGQAPSFELRAKPTSATGQFGLNLITWNKSGAGLAEAPARPIATAVTVEGNTLRYAVALTDIPRIATLIWLFGASAQLPSNDFVLDDCNNMGDQTRPDGTTAPTSAPPSTLPKVALGVPLTHRSGAIVTIDDVQNPPVELQPLPIAPDEGNVPAVVFAEVCAGEQATGARAGAFGIVTTDGEIYPFWDAPQGASLPAFPSSEPLEPRACAEGWITFQLPAGAVIDEAFYSPSSDGSDYLSWTVPTA